MCSILITNRKAVDYLSANKYQRLRGPDRTSIEYIDDAVFLHNLLSITGTFSPQPFVKNGVHLLFNGEIYNYTDFGNYASDGFAVLDAYAKYGEHFAQYLDGEFAIVLYDANSEKYIFATDPFATKPLYFATDGNDYVFSSYESAANALGFRNVQKVQSNCIFTFRPRTGEVEKVGQVYEFKLSQHKTNFDDWIESFRESVKKRTKHGREKLFIGLSSGYDSGAISCILNSEELSYTAYTLAGREDADTVRQRFSLIVGKNEAKLIFANPELMDQAKTHLYNTVEDYYYKIYSSVGDYNEYGLELKADQGALGLSIICMAARADGRKVYLSGQGADEIISDYGFAGHRIYRHSNFGGLFPDNLESIFPWASFYGSSQESYLMKEEQVAGSYGIEARYPFLDKKVVQEYLHLHPRLKNSRYKAPLAHLFECYEYPYKENQKIGFSVTA